MVPDAEFPGVYLLAQFADTPPDCVDCTCKNVVYIGESCDQSIGKRLYQFNRSAFQSKDGHSAGWTYGTKLGDDGRTLFVSAFPVRIVEQVACSAFVRFAERKLIWEYVRMWGALPVCNTK